ncbi:MAG: type II toxin-antitoxin system VapC family toxin [Thermodesulfobacteriota bacterium]
MTRISRGHGISAGGMSRGLPDRHQCARRASQAGTVQSRVRDWFSRVEEASLHVSVLVLGEIRRGAELLRRRDPVSAALLETWLLGLKVTLADRLLPITEEIADRWGRLGVPDPVPVTDGLLAATALVHDLTLVTRNVHDVERTGARLLNPFS